MKEDIDKHILFAFLEGNATLMQRVRIEQWLEEKANQELYYQWIEEWENQNLQLVPDTEAAYQKSLLRIRHSAAGPVRATVPPGVVPEGVGRRTPVRYWRVAASVALLVASLGWLWTERDRVLTREYRSGYGEVVPLTLPDGSRVVLNANSTLRVPRFGFGKTAREVVLSGEARFSVQHTQSHQRFIVRTPQQLAVEVLGTEFVVFSRPRGSKVVLNKGKVRLWGPNGGLAKPLALRPGDVVTIAPTGGMRVQHGQAVEMHHAWEEKRFVFLNTSVREITAMLKENYGITVLVPDTSVADRTFGGTFKVTKPETLLRSLSELLDLQLVAVNASTYQLKEADPESATDQQ
jgi:ferric-dicitrate binding protein FerR (iron transport regulator)